ncbi:MAG: septum formation inhibitor Maf [Gammaproteobacteria bacterium]|nr:MAG: septum formation inhibitor Maf [Gammaproteobacteria bacterium]
MMTFVLASASPRRRALLEQLGLHFSVVVADIDETPRDGEPAETLALRLAQQKALEVLVREPEATVLASDTVVVLDGAVLGKPVDEADAARMLRLLSGKTHQVLTAVSIVRQDYEDTFLVTTDVTFRSLSEAEIHAYVLSREPLDKAGAYGIQGVGGAFVRSIRGSYSAVVGLPLCETVEGLRRAGLTILGDGAA